MRRRRKARHSIGGSKWSRGAHHVPAGGYTLGNMPKAVPADGKPTRIRIHAVYRDNPDLKRLAQVLIEVGKQIAGREQAQANIRPLSEQPAWRGPTRFDQHRDAQRSR